MNQRRRSRLPVALACAVALAATAAPAAADSLVFTRPDGNVWLANPDGSGLHQVTLDGSAGDPYESPSQADDGTIVAIRGSGSNELIYRLAQNGAVLSSFKPAVEFSLGLFDAEVSRDGSKVAYWTGYVGDSNCIEVPAGTMNSQFCYSTEITSSTAAVDSGAPLSFRSNPSWMSASRVLTGGKDSFLSTYDLGDPDDATWVNTGDPHDPELTAAGDRLVATGGFSQEELDLYSTAGDPRSDDPPLAPTVQCTLIGPAGGRFSDPTWAPDGSGLAWEEGDGDSSTAPGPGEGIWVWNLGGGSLATACSATLPSGVLIAGASKPDWGPADINPGPRPAPPGSGGGNGGGGQGGQGQGGQGQGQNQGQGQTQTQTETTTQVVVSNAFQFGATKSSSSTGTVKVNLVAPGAGVFQLSAESVAAFAARKKRKTRIRVASKRVTVSQAGSVAVSLSPSKRARKVLKKRGSLKSKLTVTFTPTGGAARTDSRTITFKLKPKRR